MYGNDCAAMEREVAVGFWCEDKKYRSGVVRKESREMEAYEKNQTNLVRYPSWRKLSLIKVLKGKT